MRILRTLGMAAGAVVGYQLLIYFSLGIPVLVLGAVAAVALMTRSLHTRDLDLSASVPKVRGWILGTAGIFFAGLGLQNLLLYWPVFRLASEELARRFSGFDTVTLVVAVLVQAPLAEEVVFRRMLRLGVLRHGVPGWTLGATAVAFTLAHHPAQMPWAFLAGVWLGKAAEQEEALLWPVVLHAFLNLMSFTLLPFLPDFPPGWTGAAVSLGVVIAGGALALFACPKPGQYPRLPALET